MAIPINANVEKEWATGLVGLRMKVPGSWWDKIDSSGHQLHTGKIHSINFEQTQNQNYWQLQLDDVVDELDLYPMKYYAVLKYADESCPLYYSSFRLPAQFVPNPVNETATMPSTSETKIESSKEYICTEPVD